jgi:hypothetical protein
VTTAIIIVNVILVQIFAKETYSRRSELESVTPVE